MFWTVLVLVCVPVVASIVSHSIGGWAPEGDDAWVARRTMQVFSTAPPLIGQEASSIDPSAPTNLNHPGPIAYYLVAPFYAASGWSPVGLAIGVGAVSLLALATSVVLAWRTAGERGVVAAGLGIVFVSVRVGQEFLVRPSNAVVILFPVVATALGVWAYLQRDRVGLAVTLLAGSFCLQASLETVPVGALAVATVAIVAWWRRRAGERGPALTGWAKAVIGVLVVMWVPPVLDLLVRWPGNVGQMVDRFTGDGPTAGGTTTHLGVGPALASVVTYLTNIPGLDHLDLGSDSVELVHLGQLKLVSLVVGLAVAIGVVGWAWSGGSAALRSLVKVAGGAIVVGVLAFSRRPNDTLYSQTYFIIWIQGVVAVAWTTVALAAIEVAQWLLRQRSHTPAARTLARRIPVQVGLAAAIVLALVPLTRPIHRAGSRPVNSLSAQIQANVPEGTYLVVGDGFVPWVSTAKGVGLDLLVHGYDIRFQEGGGMEDEPRRRGTGQLPRLVISTRNASVDGRDVVARSRADGIVQQVRLIPGGRDASWCFETGEIDERLRGITKVPVADDPVAAMDTPAEWIRFLRGLDLAVVQALTHGKAIRVPVDTLRNQRRTELAALRSGTVAEPSAGYRDALKVLIVTYGWRCDARFVKGAVRLGDREPPGHAR